MLSVVMLSVVMLSVVMLNVVAPFFFLSTQKEEKVFFLSPEGLTIDLTVLTLKHYGLVIYKKWTDSMVTYCQSLSMDWTTTPAYYQCL